MSGVVGESVRLAHTVWVHQVTRHHVLRSNTARVTQRQRAFLADTSHGLRAPLTVVRGQLEVLARQGEIGAPDVQRVGRFVRAEVERMQRLVDDLLLLAHADEPAFLSPQEIDLSSYVAELLESFRTLGAFGSSLSRRES